MYEGTQIDEATQAAIYKWYKRRRVCDNDAFGDYFNRQISLIESQYFQYLRVQTTEIDPMVAEYIERQTRGQSMMTEQTKNEKTLTSTDNGTNLQTEGGEDVDSTTYGKKIEDNGTTNSTLNRTDKANNVTTNDTKQVTAETRDDNTTTNRMEDRQSLRGDTPDSSTYGEGGFPAELNWQYTSMQSEDKGVTDETVITASTVDNTVTNTGTITNAIDDTQNETGNVTGNNATQESGTDTKTLKYGKTVNCTNNMSHSGSENEAANVDSKRDELQREIVSARHEAPQDLLNRARDYILRTNAFKWLISQLDNCFMSIYSSY